MNKFARFFLPLATVFFALPAFAQDGSGGAKGYIAIGAGLTIGLAALGGALGQGRAASSMLDGLSRNPSASDKMFVPFILGLAFIESLVLLAWLVGGAFIGPMK